MFHIFKRLRILSFLLLDYISDICITKRSDAISLTFFSSTILISGTHWLGVFCWVHSGPYGRRVVREIERGLLRHVGSKAGAVRAVSFPRQYRSSPAVRTRDTFEGSNII